MKRKRGRYGNVKRTVVNGIKFASQHEATRYGELRLLEAYDKIHDLKLQPRYPIVIGRVPVVKRSERYPNGRPLTYVADFSYIDTETGNRIIEDVKMQSGHKTEVYKIKRALMDAMGYRITEV